MKYFSIIITLIVSFILNGSYAQSPEKPPVEIKLYTIDCGRIDVSNLAEFSDTGDYNNKSVQLADPCFLIVHPKGILLWDTGLPESLIQKPMTAGVYRLTRATTLAENLKKINLKPDDIQYVTVSHSHFDHMGNINQFPKATWILQNAELAYGKTHPSPFVTDASTLSNWKTVHKKMISGDDDVFGDGTVQLISTPGHTPGHQSLLLKLPHAGFIILSGDAFHQRTSFEPVQVPAFNTSRAETIASAERIKGLMKTYHARLVVQHDAHDFESLPAFPGYLD